MNQSQRESIAHFRSAKKCHAIASRISNESKQGWIDKSWLHLILSIAYLNGDLA